MKHFIISLVCCVFCVVPLKGDNVESDETAEDENEESVVTIRTLLSEDGGEEGKSLITIFTDEEKKPIMSGMRTPWRRLDLIRRINRSGQELLV